MNVYVVHFSVMLKELTEMVETGEWIEIGSWRGVCAEDEDGLKTQVKKIQKKSKEEWGEEWEMIEWFNMTDDPFQMSVPHSSFVINSGDEWD